MESCAICKKEGSLLICKICVLKVHPECYGIYPEDPWTCDTCLLPGGKCSLCPPQRASISLGPLRKSSSTDWTHLVCIKFIKEAYLDKQDRAVPIKGLENLDPNALYLRCTICETMSGFCVNCAEPACSQVFHPSCAVVNNLKINLPYILCMKHSVPAVKSGVTPIAPYKIKEDKKTIQTRVLNSSYLSSSMKNPKRCRGTKINCDFDRVSEYFSNCSLKILSKTALPYDKSGFTLPSNAHRVSNTCRVLFQSQQKDALLSFKVGQDPHYPSSLGDDFIIFPRLSELSFLKYRLALESFTQLSKEQSQEYELLSRCLNETIPAEDEVTKEILFLLEHFSRKIIPNVNTNKLLVERQYEKKKKLDMTEIHRVCIQSWVCMQWTLIYKNLKSGLEDKSLEYYHSRDETSLEIKKIDCSICFNYDEENAILNPIVYCVGCKLFMHKACIGVQNPPEVFTCQVCLSKSSPSCLICFCKEWPMKSVECQWVHITCALWDERADFSDKQFLEGILLNGSTQLGICNICRKPNGLLSKCQQCNKLCHLMCAWRSGFKFMTKDINTAHRRVQAMFICDTHGEERNYELQKKLRLNAFLNYLSPRLMKKRVRENKEALEKYN